MYKVIKTEQQYYEYCNTLEKMIIDEERYVDEIELLTLLIETWDQKNNALPDLDPIQLVKLLMSEHNLKAKDLSEILGLSKGTVSKILNYKVGLSKPIIRKLSAYFKISQESLNRHYPLHTSENRDSSSLPLINPQIEIYVSPRG